MTAITGTRTQAWSDSRPTARKRAEHGGRDHPHGSDLEGVDQRLPSAWGTSVFGSNRIAQRAGSSCPLTASRHSARPEQREDRRAAPTTVPIRCRRRARGPGTSNRTVGAHRTIATRRSMIRISAGRRQRDDQVADHDAPAKTSSSWSAFGVAQPLQRGRQVGDGEAGGDRGVLRQRDPDVAQRRHDGAERLRQDDGAQRLAEVEAERPGGLGLPGGHRVDARPQRLADERRRVEGQRRDGGDEAARELQVDLDDAEGEEEEDHRQRGVAEDLDVEGGQRPQRAGRGSPAWRPGACPGAGRRCR